MIVRVAAVQDSPVFLDRDATVEKAVALIGEAAAGGAGLVAFPESFVPCYPAWVHGAAGWEDAFSKRAYARLRAESVEVPGPACDRLAAAAAEHGVHVVVGVTERAGGTLYNSLLALGPAGLLGVHRKLVPTHAERIVWGQGDGSTLHVYDTAVGRLGGLVCWEHWMPLARFAMHARGEQIHVAAWPDLPEIHHLASRHYAFEGRCFVVCAGQFLDWEDVPEEFHQSFAAGFAGERRPGEGPLLAGGSGVVGPDGSWLAGPVAGLRTIVYADADLDAIAPELQALDVAGHFNRPDVFRLTVDTTPRVPLHELHG